MSSSIEFVYDQDGIEPDERMAFIAAGKQLRQHERDIRSKVGAEKKAAEKGREREIARIVELFNDWSARPRPTNKDSDKRKILTKSGRPLDKDPLAWSAAQKLYNHCRLGHNDESTRLAPGYKEQLRILIEAFLNQIEDPRRYDRSTAPIWEPKPEPVKSYEELLAEAPSLESIFGPDPWDTPEGSESEEGDESRSNGPEVAGLRPTDWAHYPPCTTQRKLDLIRQTLAGNPPPTCQLVFVSPDTYHLPSSASGVEHGAPGPSVPSQPSPPPPNRAPDSRTSYTPSG